MRLSQDIKRPYKFWFENNCKVMWPNFCMSSFFLNSYVWSKFYAYSPFYAYRWYPTRQNVGAVKYGNSARFDCLKQFIMTDFTCITLRIRRNILKIIKTGSSSLVPRKLTHISPSSAWTNLLFEFIRKNCQTWYF